MRFDINKYVRKIKKIMAGDIFRYSATAVSGILITMLICFAVVLNDASVRTEAGFSQYAWKILPQLKVYESESEGSSFSYKVSGGKGVAVNKVETEYDYVGTYIDSYVRKLEKNCRRDVSGFDAIVVDTAISSSKKGIVSLVMTYNISKLDAERMIPVRKGIKTVRFNKKDGSTLVWQQIFMKSYPEKVREHFRNRDDKYSNYVINDEEITYFFVENDALGKEAISAYKVTNTESYGWMRTAILERWLDPSKPMIALTFDDGPGGKAEERIHKVLKKYNAKATFFYSGYMIKGREYNIRDSVKAGYEIGNHTWNHPYLPNCSDKELKKQFEKTNSLIEKAGGKYPTVFRPSYGATTKHVNKKANLPVIIWDIDTLDWKSKNAKKVYKSVIKNKHLDGSIVLMHCIYPSTAEATEKIVPWLAEQGYQMVTVSELLRYHDGVTPKPAKEYHGW